MVTDGTAIGNAIANGVNRLKDSDSKSKTIILLTDGVNNAGEVDPASSRRNCAEIWNKNLYYWRRHNWPGSVSGANSFWH